MAAPPRFKTLTREDFADAPPWFDRLVAMLNETLGALSGALARRLTRAENMLSGIREGATFTTAATVDDTWPVELKADPLVRPKHVWVTKFARQDGVPLSAAWSMSWGLTSAGNLGLTFQGLDASTQYVFSVVYE